jgi:hypothetical protein
MYWLCAQVEDAAGTRSASPKIRSLLSPLRTADCGLRIEVDAVANPQSAIRDPQFPIVVAIT